MGNNKESNNKNEKVMITDFDKSKYDYVYKSGKVTVCVVKPKLTPEEYEERLKDLSRFASNMLGCEVTIRKKKKI